jgi:hypothetical protein
MTAVSTRLLLGCSALLAACGPSLKDPQDVAAVLAQASVPSPGARGAAFSLLASGAGALPQPSITLPGAHGGEATLDFNLVAAAVGLLGEGLLFNVHYSGYSDDGALFLDGDVAVLANFSYVDGADPYADLKLTLAGRANVSGAYWDELHARIVLTTRVSDLTLRGADIRLRLDGTVDANEGRFQFTQEDLDLLWDRLTAAPR